MALISRLRRPARRPGGPTATEPVSRQFGLERGRPIDRWYIERFLERHSADVRGRVLEVYEDTYTRRFGGDHVERNDVLHHGDDNPQATIAGDLQTGDGIPQAAYDCFICTQTLHLIPDVEAAIAGTRAALAPGGVLLCTLPGISQICRDDVPTSGDWRRFTTMGARRLFTAVYGDDNVEIGAGGNVLSAACFLYGYAVEELDDAELARDDPDYELIVTVRAIRANGS